MHQQRKAEFGHQTSGGPRWTNGRPVFQNNIFSTRNPRLSIKSNKYFMCTSLST